MWIAAVMEKFEPDFDLDVQISDIGNAMGQKRDLSTARTSRLLMHKIPDESWNGNDGIIELSGKPMCLARLRGLK